MSGYSKYPTQLDDSTSVLISTDNVTPVKSEIVNRQVRMGKRHNTEYFISKSQKIHGDTYIYDQSIYFKSKSKIKIICRTHGIFEQIAYDHMQGRGCNKCCPNKRMKFDDFIVRAKNIHKTPYSYDKFIFVNGRTKGMIICPIHSGFFQAPTIHLRGHGCPKCANEVIANKISLNTEKFIELAKIKHENKYDYSKVHYTKNEREVIITCLIHKYDFLQKPHNHLSGSGCQKCGLNYKYLENKWLDKLKISNRQFKIMIGNRRFFADGFDPRTNIIYEFNGDSWHGNPKLFKSEDIHPVNKKTYGELYQKTLERKSKLEAAGYKVISIWESDFKKEINE